MASPAVVVLGGGLSGMTAAYTLARGGVENVTLVERARELGGLAGTFRKGSYFYPLGYHHILHRDRTLLFVLDRIGALDDVRWRKIRMFFRLGERVYDFTSPWHFLRFPMSPIDKFRFVRLMLKSFRKADWSDWNDRSAAELVDTWAGPAVRTVLFDPLSRLKFDMPCTEVSGAWLGARLHCREGSAPLGYIPGCNWTKVLCDGLARLIEEAGVKIRAGCAVIRLHIAGDRVDEIELETGASLHSDFVVSTVPTEVYRTLAVSDDTPELARIRYTALLSVICTSQQEIHPDFYWMSLASLDCNACGIFLLDSLNPTIGRRGESCVNFVTHLRSRDSHGFQRSDDAVLDGYLDDFRKIIGFDLDPTWSQINRVAMYSPVFERDYRNPPLRSTSLHNVYFAGNFRTFPSIASTGTAMASGIETAQALLSELGTASDLPDRVRRFRPVSMPRAERSA